MKMLSKEEFIALSIENDNGVRNDESELWVTPFGNDNDAFYVKLTVLEKYDVTARPFPPCKNWADIDLMNYFEKHAFDISYNVEENRNHIAWDFLYGEYLKWYYKMNGGKAK